MDVLFLCQFGNLIFQLGDSLGFGRLVLAQLRYQLRICTVQDCKD